MKSMALVVLLVACVTTDAAAQGLRDRITGLFIFGAGDDILFLGGSGDPSNPQFIQVHGNHFIPAAVASNGSLISSLTNAIGANVAELPVSATSSGTTFRIQAGVPVPTSTSAGPIYAERAQTLGRGRVFVSASVSVFDFKTLRGADLNSIRLDFTHENVDFPGCDSTFTGDCSLYGVPSFENDIIELDLGLDINVRATTFVLTYGVLDKLDIGVVLPFIRTSIRGQSEARIIPFEGPPVAHFFGGTTDNPVLTASRVEEGSATGLGDIATRVKMAVAESERSRVALLVDARLPTGSEDDFLGSGHFAMRGLGIISSQFGNFSPHANLGYLFRTGSGNNDAVLATVGFDHLMAPSVTLAADVVAEFQVGENRFPPPEPVVIEAPFDRTITPSSIPNRRDDLVNGALGFKFLTGSGVTIVANALWPLNRGGLRPDIAWTAALEYSF